MAKKSFNIENPAEQFISKPIERIEEAKVEASEEAPKGYKLNPKYIEKKDRRLQLLLQPSVYDAIKAKAESQGKSVNNFIHELLEKEINQ